MAKAPYIENYVPAVRLAKGINTKKSITAGGGITIPTGKTLTITDTAAITTGGFILPNLEYLQTSILAAATFAASTSYPFWTCPNDGATWQIAAMSARFTTAAGSAATFQVEVAGAGVAPGSGTAQNSSGVALNGSANTTVNATITTQTAIAAGASINFVVGSTATTSLAGLVITVALQRLS